MMRPYSSPELKVILMTETDVATDIFGSGNVVVGYEDKDVFIDDLGTWQ